MTVLILWLLTSYIAGFCFITQRAKSVLKLADENWPEGEEYIVKNCVRNVKKGTKDYYEGVIKHNEKSISLCGGGPLSKIHFNKEDWISFSRGIHVFWFATSPIWADVFSVFKFVKFVCTDINPMLGKVFEQDLTFKSMKPMYIEENLTLKAQIREMQAQIEKLAKKPVKKSSKRKAKKKKVGKK